MKYSLFAIVGLGLALFSCNSEKGFELVGHIKNFNDGEIVIINLQDEESKDTIKVKDGKFSFHGISTEPTPYLLFAPEILPAQAIFFVDKGKTHIEFTAQQPETFLAKGCKTQQEFDGFLHEVKPILLQMDSLQGEAIKSNDPALHDALGNIYLALQNEYEQKNLDFVTEHPNSFASALLSYEYLRSKTNLAYKEKEKIANALSQAVKESYFGKKINELLAEEKLMGEGEIAPALSLPDSKGQMIGIENFRGKYLLVDFWASWCTPCRAENPFVVAAYNKFKKNNFEILGVSLDEDKKNWTKAIEMDGLHWTHISDLKGWNSIAVSIYHLKSIPSNILLDPEGRILAKDLRGAELETKLSTIFKN